MPRCARVSLGGEDVNLSIFPKTILLVVGPVWLWPVAAGAQGLTCRAEAQCRGDAEKMCAPSNLSIMVERRGAAVDMWIDRQGPYRAELSQGAHGLRLTLPLFKHHEMVVEVDGRFLYRGNRGKRFTGTCEGAI